MEYKKETYKNMEYQNMGRRPVNGFRSEQMKTFAREKNYDILYGRDITNDVIDREVAVDRYVYNQMFKAGIVPDKESIQAQNFNNYAAHQPYWTVQQTRQCDEPLDMDLVPKKELARAQDEYNREHRFGKYRKY